MSEDSAHLLLVDDDAGIRGLLRRFLARHGFLVTLARDAAQARLLMQGISFDLVVLDVMMPGEDGMSLTRSITSNFKVPVLLLSARGDAGDRISGLESGADDYLPKPFQPKELLLRIRAILRRSPPAAAPDEAPDEIMMGQYRYCCIRGELWHGDRRIGLTGREGELMSILAARAGQTVSRSQLSSGDTGGGGTLEQQRGVNVQIARLRRKIESDPGNPRYLQTVRGEGYMLAPD